MFKLTNRYLFFLFLLACCYFFNEPVKCLATQAPDSGKKILIVMSYHSGYPWQEGIKRGIESVLTKADLKYFDLDTKNNKKSGKARAKEAYDLYQKFKPDVVIASDDNAQSLFVVPFLKEKVETPVIFCGVNNYGEKHGYPAANVTGVLEINHYREGITLAQLIDPKIKKIGLILRDTTSNQGHLKQINKEKEMYSVEIAEIAIINTMAEAQQQLKAMETKVDALFIQNLTGVTDLDGKNMEGDMAIKEMLKSWKKPSITDSDWGVKAGVLCAVAKTGEEQGATAALMALDIFSGKTVADIPITRNHTGQRIINVMTANELGFKLKPIVLLGTTLLN